jgi:hypothetical protein
MTWAKLGITRYPITFEPMQLRRTNGTQLSRHRGSGIHGSAGKGALGYRVLGMRA